MAIRKFVNLVKTYLSCFGQESNEAMNVMEDIYNNYLSTEKIRNYQNLNKARSALQNREKMKIVWRFMHTEFLCAFNECYDIQQKCMNNSLISSKMVSYFDMCRNCERFLLRLKDSVISENDYNGQSYKILFGSLYSWPEEDGSNSRDRNGDALLLKVVYKI